MTPGCRFCRIISGELPAAVVLDDDSCMAFLDKRPLFAGHCLLLPRVHHETLLDLPDALTHPLFSNARLLCRAVEESMQAEGTFVAINNKVSQSVPHLHVHVVPRRKKDGLKGFFWPRHPYRDEEHLQEVAGKIKDCLARCWHEG
ncbi:MAG: HIT family protein [Syntrophobacteraceae bacterium]